MDALLPALLLLIYLPENRRARLAQHFELIYAPDAQTRQSAIEADGARVRAVLSNGSIGLSPQDLDALPRLELLCALGAGYENLPLEQARARGIVCANGAGTNEDCVADHAMALMLATVRSLAFYENELRNGKWRSELPIPQGLTGKRVGIFGMGGIGRKIAQRASAFGMAVSYHNRRVRPELSERYFESLEALAHWADILVVAVPGGASTRHQVDARILEALGPHGYLINIARGSVVDTTALCEALQGARLAGAGLDVFEGEPQVPAALLRAPNVLLTPHIGGSSGEALDASVQRFLDNAERHFAGAAPLSPI